MNVLSLFDGISCGRVALERAGIKIDSYYAAEIDKNAIKVAQDNFPDTIHLGDINGIDLGKLPKIDLIMGGSPCQGFSRAGIGLNFDDPRSKLFFKFVETLNCIRENNNPGVKFLLENVVMNTEWSDIISEYMGVKPIKIDSVLMTPQSRPRLYWTNIPGVEQPEDAGMKLKYILEDVDTTDFIDYRGLKIDPSISENSMKLIDNLYGEVRITQATKQGYIVAEDGDGVNISFPLSKSRRGRVLKGKSSCLDCVCNICVFTKGSIRRFTITEIERLQTLPKGYTKILKPAARMKAIGNGWTVDVIAHIFSYMEAEKALEKAM